MTIYRIADCYSSIQGEGTLTGVPMVILRLQGCGVGCPFCDTKETWLVDNANRVETLERALGATVAWTELSASEIAAYIRWNHKGPKWVMVTGGEPADQDLEALVNALHDAGFKVALETSGTAAGHLPAAFDWVCVSPKIAMPGGKVILGEVLRSANEIKHVVGKQADIDKLDALLKEHQMNGDSTICLQPMSQSEKATRLCMKTAMERGWRLSVQIHKYLALR